MTIKFKYAVSLHLISISQKYASKKLVVSPSLQIPYKDRFVLFLQNIDIKIINSV